MLWLWYMCDILIYIELRYHNFGVVYILLEDILEIKNTLIVSWLQRAGAVYGN